MWHNLLMMRENEENSLITQDWICPYMLLIKLMFSIFRSINVWMNRDAHRGPPNHESWKKNIQWPPYWVSTHVHLCLRYRTVWLDYKSQERHTIVLNLGYHFLIAIPSAFKNVTWRQMYFLNEQPTSQRETFSHY